MPEADRRTLVRRRAVLTTALTGSILGLTGCSIRVARDAPDIPGLRSQAAPADQPVLGELLDSVRRARAEAGAVSASGWPRRLQTLHAAQAGRLLAVMATQGMTAPPDPPAVAPTGADGRELAVIERAGALRVGSFAGLTTRNLPMAASVAVTQCAAARILGLSTDLVGASVPGPTQSRAVLPSLQAATYAFEVLIAKTPPRERARAEGTLTMLRSARATWEAALGGAAPVQPDGYDLPVQPTTTDARSRLARSVLAALVDACAGQAAGTRADRPALLGVAQLWSDATADLWLWGAPLAPFPGLR